MQAGKSVKKSGNGKGKARGNWKTQRKQAKAQRHNAKKQARPDPHVPSGDKGKEPEKDQSGVSSPPEPTSSVNTTVVVPEEPSSSESASTVNTTVVGPSPSQADSSSQSGESVAPVRKVCSFYLRNACTYGNKCKNFHPPKEDVVPRANAGREEEIKPQLQFKCYLDHKSLKDMPWYSAKGSKPMYVKQLIKKSHPLSATTRSLAELKVLKAIQDKAERKINANARLIAATIAVDPVLQDNDTILDVDEVIDHVEEVENRKWLLVDNYGNDRVGNLQELNNVLLPYVEVVSCGKVHDAQDRYRRENTFSMQQTLDAKHESDYLGVSGLLTDVYAIDANEALKEFLKVGIHEVFVIRQNFTGSSGSKFDGESEWHATGDKILYSQHELQDTYYVSHTVEQEKSWQLGTKDVEYQGVVFGKWVPFTVCSVSDYSIVLWSYHADERVGNFREYVNEEICSIEATSEEEMRSELTKVKYIDRWGNTQELEVFSSLYYDGKARTALTEDTTYMLATIRHSLRTAVTSPKYLRIYQYLGHKVAYEIFGNTLRAIIDSKEYQDRSVQTWLSDFLKNYGSWLKAICWFVNFLFGLDYTPETVITNLFLGLHQRTVKAKLYANAAYEVFVSKIENIFGVKSEPEFGADMTDTFLKSNQGFTVANCDILMSAAASPDLHIVGPLAIKSEMRESDNHSILDADKWRELHDVALNVRQRNYGLTADMFTYAHFSGFRLPPNNFSAMINKAWPDADHQPKYRSECITGNSDCVVKSAFPGCEKPWWKLDMSPDAFNFGKKHCCPEGRKIYRCYSKFLQHFELPKIDFKPVSVVDYIARPDEAYKRVRRQKAADLQNQVDLALKEVSNITIMTKSDEVNRPDFDEDLVMAKVRAIFNLKPECQFLMSEYSDLYPAFKKVVNSRVTTFVGKDGNTWRLRLLMCSTCTREELSQIRNDFQYTEPRTIYVLVAGDDTNLWFRKGSRPGLFAAPDSKFTKVTKLGGTIWIYEPELEMWSLDATSCDISVGLHQHAVFFDIMDSIGLTELSELTNVLMMNGQGKLHFGDNWNRVKIFMDMIIQTFSGEIFTSFKNTLVISVLLFGFLIDYFETTREANIEMEDFVHKFGKHSGFTLEGECFVGEEECKSIDFLKGWWVPTGGSYEFMPLPSRILTYGKTRTNYVHTTPGKKNPERSARYAAYATSRCNAVIPRDYPILGSYLDMCDRVSIGWDMEGKIKHFDSIYREPGMGPLFGGSEAVKVSKDVVLDMIKSRYGDKVSSHMIQLDDFVNEIDFDSFTGFTVTAGFPWLSILRDRDYGKPKDVKAKPAPKVTPIFMGSIDSDDDSDDVPSLLMSSDDEMAFADYSSSSYSDSEDYDTWQASSGEDDFSTI